MYRVTIESASWQIFETCDIGSAPGFVPHSLRARSEALTARDRRSEQPYSECQSGSKRPSGEPRTTGEQFPPQLARLARPRRLGRCLARQRGYTGEQGSWKED
jgi:hypothetical protein